MTVSQSKHMKKIPLFDIEKQSADLRESLVDAAIRVIDSGRYILGPEVAAFEKEFAAVIGAKYCCGAASGTSALELALSACGIGPGDEVALPAFSFIATATCVTVRGATPIFVDIDPNTLTMDAVDLERRITSKTKAVIPVHLYGRPADMTAILKVTQPRKLRVIEDCAQSHLAKHAGSPAGVIGDIGAFSFYPSKNMGAIGDAGALTTNDPHLYETLVSLSNCGRSAGKQYDHIRVGYNGRLDEIQAAFLRIKLRRLEEWTAARREISALYTRLLADTPLRLPPALEDGSESACHLFVVQTEQRDALKAHLETEGIASAIYYPTPIHKLSAYAHLNSTSLPACERAAKEVLALPLYPELSSADAEGVAAAVCRFFKK